MGEKKPNWFESFTLFMDQNIRGIQYGVYSVALVGLAVSLRSVRPFKKFSKPGEIPTSFIVKHLTLHGKAVGVEPSMGSSTAYLLVDHAPIISLAWIRPKKPNLPLQISSINLTPNGLSWLQHIVVGSTVKFTILKVNPEAVTCIISKENKDVGLDLVSLGFASVSPLDFNLEKDSLYLKYYKKLLSAENLAEKRGYGIWASEKNSTSYVFNKLGKIVISSAASLLGSLRKTVTKSITKKSGTPSAWIVKA